MQTWSNAVLSFVARASDHFGATSKALDSLMNRIVTVKTAQASTCGDYSWYYCSNLSYCIFAYACPESNQLQIAKYVQHSVDNCHNPYATTCTLDLCYGC